MWCASDNQNNMCHISMYKKKKKKKKKTLFYSNSAINVELNDCFSVITRAYRISYTRLSKQLHYQAQSPSVQYYSST